MRTYRKKEYARQMKNTLQIYVHTYYYQFNIIWASKIVKHTFTYVNHKNKKSNLQIAAVSCFFLGGGSSMKIFTILRLYCIYIIKLIKW